MSDYEMMVAPLMEMKTNCGVAKTVADVPISRDSLRRLRPGRWLNDELINGYVELVNQVSSKSLVMNTFFFQKILDEQA